MFLRYLAAVVAFIFFYNHYGYGQSYGLQFAASEVIQEQRTGIDLSPQGSLCIGNDFEVSFDIGFVPGKVDYFGYIIRIIDAKKQNIDLIFDRDVRSKRPLKLAIGETSVEFPYDIDKNNYFKGWLTIRLRYSVQTNLLIMFAGDKKYEIKLRTPMDKCLRILYGASNFDDFKTTDVPPIRVRNIEIRTNDKLKYQWPLDNVTGSEVKDQQSGKTAFISNPQWIRQMHVNWRKVAGFQSRGAVSAAFDPVNDLIYIVGSDSLYRFSVSQDKLLGIPISGHQNLLLGNQSYFDAKHNQLFNINIDQGIVSVYDSIKRQWDKNFSLPDPLTNYWHYNKLYVPKENAFYLFGGYGHFTYKNTVQKIDIFTGIKSIVKPSGDFFTPRYLAGLGESKEGAYIIGGYGSKKGKQILKSHCIYDLLHYDRKQNRFRKIYELKSIPEDFVFANSIVVDETEDNYYGLIFQKHKFKSALQLVKGSLKKPVMEELGDQIPFLFQDITSHADLFFSKRLSKFIAVSIYIDNNNIGHVNLFSISSPVSANMHLAATVASTQFEHYLLPVSVALILVLLGLFILWKTRRKKEMKKQRIQHKQRVEPEQFPVVNYTLPSAESTELRTENAIYLFGDFQALDKDGIDITKLFTPLVKELFLILLLYNLRWKRGISSERLKELLWPDKNAESASNNRSVNMAKLKALLDRMKNCSVSNDTGTWKMIMDHNSIYIDYYEYLNLIKDKKTINEGGIAKLAAISQRGNILTNLNYEWLDAFKSETANEVTGTFLNFTNTLNLQEQPDLIIQIVSYIFNFDPVNEDAMTLKCRALVHLGKHSLAKATFENFKQEYKAIYNEEFESTFKTILK